MLTDPLPAVFCDSEQTGFLFWPETPAGTTTPYLVPTASLPLTGYVPSLGSGAVWIFLCAVLSVPLIL